MKSSTGWATGISDKEFQQFKSGVWVVDCSSIELRSRGDRPATLCSGPGTISISSEGQISFKFYTQLSSETRERIEDFDVPSGVIYSEYSFFDLHARDVRGRSWESLRIRPDYLFHLGSDCVIEGLLDEISQEGELRRVSRKLWFRWEVFEKVKIPCNERTTKRVSIARGKRKPMESTLNAWRFRCLKCDFLLFDESDTLVIEMDTERHDLPKHFSTRIIETLQFVLGRPIHWLVFQEYGRGRVRTTFRSLLARSSKTRAQPPLSLKATVEHGKFSTKHHRKLFEQYLKFVATSEDVHHYLWGLINTAYESAAGSFVDVQALTLTVAVESFLQRAFRTVGQPTKQELVTISEIQEFVRGWNGDDRFGRRLEGLVSQLSQPRAKDMLDRLVVRGAIRAEHVAAWQKLRNLNTHEFQAGKIKGEKFLDLLVKVEILFYHLIFYAIGYHGLYSDYSEPGWPLRQYPER